MAHSINVRRTKSNPDLWVGSVDTKAYGAGYSLFTTEPMADRGDAYRAAEAWRTENAAKNKAKKAAKEGAHMTCQCCGRAHLANTGKMAHHGYTRPGYGWQTASCMGARELPFEVARDRLMDMIKALIRHRNGMVAFREELANEQTPIVRNWTTGPTRNRETHKFDFTRANFESDDAGSAKRKIGIYGDFDDLLKSSVASQDRKIAAITTDINESQKRYDGWKQTHTWNATAKEWATI